MQETQEMQAWFLGQEDPLEKEMTNHSSITAWQILRTEDPGGFQSLGLQRVGHNWATDVCIQTKKKYVGEPNPSWFLCENKAYLETW